MSTIKVSSSSNWMGDFTSAILFLSPNEYLALDIFMVELSFFKKDSKWELTAKTYHNARCKELLSTCDHTVSSEKATRKMHFFYSDKSLDKVYNIKVLKAEEMGVINWLMKDGFGITKPKNLRKSADIVEWYIEELKKRA